MSVLIVDDSRAIRTLVRAYVEEIGFDVVEAENGEEALGLFVSEKIDLVLMDIEMPGVDGYQTTIQLREIAKEWVPIIFLSSKRDDDHFVQGIKSGGDAYLFKPVNGPMLQSMVSAMERIARVQDELQAANQKLEMLALIDPMTQAFNRRGLMESLEKEWARATRNKHDLSILIIDVDHFKNYNDHYGHLEGDECLVKVASTIQECLKRPADILGRFGGEEFIVILPETDLDGALSVGESIREAVENAAIEHEASTTSPVVTVSVGVAWRNQEDSVQGLIKVADERLYNAKAARRNCVVAEG